MRLDVENHPLILYFSHINLINFILPFALIRFFFSFSAGVEVGRAHWKLLLCLRLGYELECGCEGQRLSSHPILLFPLLLLLKVVMLL